MIDLQIPQATLMELPFPLIVDDPIIWVKS
jgi:hypothetical protein